MRHASAVLFVAVAVVSPAHAGSPANETLPPAFDVIALFEFDGNTLDTSGNARHATLIGGDFVGSRYGSALQVIEGDVEGVAFPMGIDWSPYAGLLVHPYTVEILFTPIDALMSGDYQKLFSNADASDGGWYYVDQSFQAYSDGATLGGGTLAANQLIYLAIVSTAPDQIEVFFNGQSIGIGPKGFTGTPAEAIFFRDDAGTSRNEQLTGQIEVLRISDIARTGAEIATIAEQFPFFSDGFETPDF